MARGMILGEADPEAVGSLEALWGFLAPLIELVGGAADRDTAIAVLREAGCVEITDRRRTVTGSAPHGEVTIGQAPGAPLIARLVILRQPAADAVKPATTRQLNEGFEWTRAALRLGFGSERRLGSYASESGVQPLNWVRFHARRATIYAVVDDFDSDGGRDLSVWMLGVPDLRVEPPIGQILDRLVP